MTKILEARINAGFSQKEVALTLGVKAPSVWAWENGKSKPTAENLEALSNLYGVSVDYLLGRDESETKKEPAIPDGLDPVLIDLLVGLAPDDQRRVQDFVSGLKASHTT